MPQRGGMDGVWCALLAATTTSTTTTAYDQDNCNSGPPLTLLSRQ